MRKLPFTLSNLVLFYVYARHNFYALFIIQGECSGNDEGLFTATLQGQETLDCVLVFKPSEVRLALLIGCIQVAMNSETLYDPFVIYSFSACLSILGSVI